MATNTPPPYFPQSSLSPPDANRYRKFKLTVFVIVLVVLALLSGAVGGVVYLLRQLL